MDGPGHVLLRAGPCPDGLGAIITVEDDGPGISEEHQARVFTPFFTTKFSGTGLGLALAQTFVEQHGGSLQFESASGEGTTFYVILPGREEADEDLVPQGVGSQNAAPQVTASQATEPQESEAAPRKD